MLRKFLITTTALISLFNNSALAQITTDRSLPVNSIVNSDGNLILINGGTQGGTNLFHSFKEFSILEGQTVLFNNSLDILNIFSRVTGSSISTINGILTANGIANLFLMNPNGIVFGPNATIAIGGSFFGTTANRIVFADGFEFHANGNNSGALMTIDRPLGMGFSDPREIIVQGRGHQLRLATDNFEIGVNPVLPILGVGESRNGLRTAPYRTLGLIGGEIMIDGGILSAFSGQIELASVDQGLVFFDSNFNFNYDNISKFNNVLIDNQGLLDASGVGNSQINIHARNFVLQNGGTIFVSNFGENVADSININATESVNLIGVSDFSQLSLEELNSNTIIKGIYSYALSSGKAADIKISAKNISLQNISSLVSISFSSGDGGNIDLQAQETIKVDGFNPFSVFLPSTVTAVGANTGKTGNISIESKSLLVDNGGFILSQPLGMGEGGLMRINTTDSIKVSGASPINPEQTEFLASNIGNTNLISRESKDLRISTKTLQIDSGGNISTNTNGSGNASDIFIKAKSIKITGRIPNDSLDFTLASQISSSADQPTSFFQEFLDLSEIPSGDSGSINIIAKEVSVSDQGVINVINEGKGNAGNIKIDANRIKLDNGNISARTVSGRGGEISIKGKDLSLINNSRIEATAGGKGDGGNIVINSGSVFMENSHIKADAIEGNGGKILINTEVFLVSSDSGITATSELGVDGTVEINTPDRNLESILKPVRATILDVDLRIIQECVDDKGEKALVVMKVPGMPEFPLEEKPSNYHDPNLPQFIEISKYISEADKEFYLDNLPGNTILRTEDGTPKFVNLCLRDLIEEQQNQ